MLLLKGGIYHNNNNNMADLADRILKYLAENDGLNTIQLSQKWDVDHQKVVGAVKSLQAKGDVSIRFSHDRTR